MLMPSTSTMSATDADEGVPVSVKIRQIDAAGNRFEDEGNLSYQMIDIQAARDLGVMPITPH